MPRARLSRLSKLSPDLAARLFAEHHIVGLRQRKNGEIVKVKHATWGWMAPEAYYGLQKLHDLMPLVQEFIKGGYLLKLALINSNISIAGVSVPVGVGFYGGLLGTALPLALGEPKPDLPEATRQDVLKAIQTARLCVLAFALPFGDLFLPALYVELVAQMAAIGGDVLSSILGPLRSLLP